MKCTKREDMAVHFMHSTCSIGKFHVVPGVVYTEHVITRLS
jgi:hypothetical protein